MSIISKAAFDRIEMAMKQEILFGGLSINEAREAFYGLPPISVAASFNPPTTKQFKTPSFVEFKLTDGRPDELYRTIQDEGITPAPEDAIGLAIANAVGGPVAGAALAAMNAADRKVNKAKYIQEDIRNYMDSFETSRSNKFKKFEAKIDA